MTTSNLYSLIAHKHLPQLVLAFVALIFFYPIAFDHQTFFFGDTLLQRVPSMVFWKQQISTGELPLWNPYIFAGIPHLADLSTNSLSPLNIIYLLIKNPFVALSLLTVIEIFLTSLFMYYYLLNFVAPAPALFGAIVWAYSGTTLAAINDINSLQGIIFIPAVLLAAHQLCTHPKVINIINLSLILLLQFISGHPQYSYYTWIFTGIYLFVFLSVSVKYRLRIIFTIYALFFGLSAIQLLPFAELSHYTYRPQNLQFSNQNSLSLYDLPHFLLANIYGNWKSGTSWGPDSPLETGRANTEGYVGVVTLIFAFAATLKTKNSHAHFYLGLALLTLILAFGSSTPVFIFLRHVLPLFNKFRSPIRILTFYTLGLSYLSAVGFNFFISKYARS